MLKIKSLFILVLFSILNISVFSQDIKSNQILQQLTKSIKDAGSMKADFNLEIKMPNGKIKETNSGTLISKDKSFQINFGDNQIFCDNKTIWTYNKKNKEVQVNDYDASETTISPEKLFSNSYDKDFKYNYIGLRIIKGKKYDCIKMEPKNSKNQFSKIELFIDPVDHMIKKGVFSDKSGNSYIYTLNKVKLGDKIIDNEFTFDASKHKGVQVIDLR